jgi:hypothetical protein
MKTRLGGWIVVILLGMAPWVCSAQSSKPLSETENAWEAAFPTAKKPKWMEDLRLTFGGWIDAGIATNFNASPDNFNGPVGLIDRTAEPRISQLYFVLERLVKKSDEWDVGGRFDVLYGTDAFIAQSTNNWDKGLIPTSVARFYNLALPQLYAEVYAPVGNGLSTKVGHFYGLTNYESVMAPKNFFYSHSMSFMWDGPFTHTGVLPSYQIDNNFELTAGGVMGWNNVNAYMSVWNFLGKFQWTSDDKGTNASFAIITGDQPNLDNLTRYTFRVEHKFLTDWEGVLQWTNGIQQNDPVRNGKDTSWYGIQSYLFYNLNEELAFGLRGEWQRDQDGVRFRYNDRPGSAPINAVGPASTAPGIGSSYYEFTLGARWTPLKWVTVRPELRYDWADAANAFDAGKRQDQLMFATDVIVQY